jgi:hypothetical protein
MFVVGLFADVSDLRSPWRKIVQILKQQREFHENSNAAKHFSGRERAKKGKAIPVTGREGP